MYIKYKKAQRMQDSLITTQIQQIPKRRFLLKWNKLVTNRYALKHIADILPRIEVATAFRCIVMNKFLQEATREYVIHNHDQRLRYRALLALKRHSHRHTIKATQLQLMTQVRQFLTVKMHMRAWRELCMTRTLHDQIIDKTVMAFAHYLK